MVQFISGWFQPASPTGQQGQNVSSWGDTILAVALGALALITANAVDRKNPAMATVLRCAAGGIGLIWLFSRCMSNSNANQVPSNAAPSAPPASTSNWWGWLPRYDPNSPVVPPMPVHRTYVNPHAQTGFPHVPHGTPTPGGFPTVHRAPAQPDPTPMYQAPSTRGAPAQPMPVHPPVDSQPRQARTTYSHAAPVQPSQARTTYSHAAAPVAHPHGGGFPTVHRAQAQPDSTPMHAAPHTRGGAGGFPDVRPANLGAASGNDRVLFPAATTR